MNYHPEKTFEPVHLLHYDATTKSTYCRANPVYPPTGDQKSSWQKICGVAKFFIKGHRFGGNSFSRRRRFFGGEFLSEVRFFGRPRHTTTLEICGAVQRPLRPACTPQTLLFLCRFVMTSSSLFFCATLRRCARPGTFSNILLHVYQTIEFRSMAPDLASLADFKMLYLSAF